MEERPLIVGAVATHPESVRIWEGIRAHFTDLGAPMDYTLYSNFDRLTEQLMSGQVDVAWLSPLAFVRARRKAGAMVVPLLVGDTHRDVRSHVVMPVQASAFSLAALRGATIAVGSRDSATARVLPLYFLREAGVDLAQLRVLPQEVDVGKGGETSGAEQQVATAVREGRAQAGVVGEHAWREMVAAGASEGLRVVWSSPAYDGAVFCSLASVPTVLRLAFERSMRAMDLGHPRQRLVLERCGISGWVPARESGYASLKRAVEELSIW